MTAQTMQIGNRPCRIYGEAHAEYLLLQMTGEHELCVFCKTLFRCVVAAHSHHGTVMIVGRGIAFQQANEHSRILILRANLAFVRAKALLATIMILRM